MKKRWKISFQEDLKPYEAETEGEDSLAAQVLNSLQDAPKVKEEDRKLTIEDTGEMSPIKAD